MNSVRRVFAGLLAASVLIPSMTMAQSNVHPMCLLSRSTFTLGTRGAEVSVIQSFLVEGGFLSSEPTGYFGRLTEAAVAQYQLASGIISNLSDGGVFGRRTWAYVMQSVCTAAPAPRTDINICPGPPPRPMTVVCDSTWQRILSDQGCHVGWSCVTYVTSTTASTTTQATPVKPNYAPVIYAIQGPLSVTTGNAGTWVVRANDPDNEKISYSMIWGDEGSNVSRLLDLSGEGTSYSSSNSFTHKYTNPGVYTIIGYVKDEQGNTNKATITVTVANAAPVTPSSTTTTTTTPPSGPDTCIFNGITYAANSTIRNPICSAIQTTCSVSRYFKCVNKSWVPTNDPGSVTGEMCFIHGRGYAVGKIYGDDAVSYGDPDSSLGGCRASGDTADRCAPSDKFVCGSSGWHGPNISGTPRTGCMASNHLFINVDAHAYGNCVSQAQGECTPGAGNTKTGYYVCKSDGWWISTPAAALVRITTVLPNIEGYY